MKTFDTHLNEIIDILDLVKFDLSDSEYDSARAVLLAGGTLKVKEFDLAVKSGDLRNVLVFFHSIAS